MRLDQSNFEKVSLLCRDWLVNLCRKTLASEFCLPLSKHLKVKILYDAPCPFVGGFRRMISKEFKNDAQSRA